MNEAIVDLIVLIGSLTFLLTSTFLWRKSKSIVKTLESQRD